MSSCDASMIVQSNLGIFSASGCSPLRMGSIPKNGVRRHVLSIRPRCGAFIAAGESHARFLTNLMNWTGSRYSFSSVKLVIFENDPLYSMNGFK